MQDSLVVIAEARLKKLKPLYAKLTARLKSAPVGILRVLTRGRSFSYYHITKKGDTNGKIIPKNNQKLAAALAQRDYEKKLKQSVEKEIRLLEKVTKNYRKIPLEQYYETLSAGRKRLVEPLVLSDREFAEKWQKVSYKGKTFASDAPQYYTENNERVRSKSELMIANALKRAGVPYRYEFPLELKEFGTVYPDFTCLDSNTRTEIIWEHLGMMDSPEYAAAAVKKVNHYLLSGYIPGRNMILSMEGSGSPLSTKIVSKIIEECFA
ncbi:MAG: hypothetical protein KBT11_01830 [Treponema sp.]|nr:hypothetical protein [Candidatus Treponema equifaecale]